VSVRGLALFEILAGVATVAVVWAFLTRTRYGLYVRAGSEDDEMLAALSVDVRRVFTLVFALGAGIAGAAGVLLMWDGNWGASVPLAAETLLPAFVVVIVGGLGTFRGTVIAAGIVGLADAVTTWWFQNYVAFTGLPEMTVFLILVVVLIFRPQGLFGVEEVGGH
jgi:branched-chain amino acid transport system permease protein